MCREPFVQTEEKMMLLGCCWKFKKQKHEINKQSKNKKEEHMTN